MEGYRSNLPDPFEQERRRRLRILFGVIVLLPALTCGGFLLPLIWTDRDAIAPPLDVMMIGMVVGFVLAIACIKWLAEEE